MLCNFYKENIESEESPARMEWRKTKDFFFLNWHTKGEKFQRQIIEQCI